MSVFSRNNNRNNNIHKDGMMHPDGPNSNFGGGIAGGMAGGDLRANANHIVGVESGKVGGGGAAEVAPVGLAPR